MTVNDPYIEGNPNLTIFVELARRGRLNQPGVAASELAAAKIAEAVLDHVAFLKDQKSVGGLLAFICLANVKHAKAKAILDEPLRAEGGAQ